MSFTVSPNVRDITFHHPDRLSPREHFFDYCGLEDGRQADGTSFTKVQEALTKAVTHLPPDEITEVIVEAVAGSVIGVSHEVAPHCFMPSKVSRWARRPALRD